MEQFWGTVLGPCLFGSGEARLAEGCAVFQLQLRPCCNMIGASTSCALLAFDENGNPLTLNALTLNGRPAIDRSSLAPDQQFQAGPTAAVNATNNCALSNFRSTSSGTH